MRRITATLPEPTMDDWEDEVTEEIKLKLDIIRGDAQGITEVQEFYIMQAWAQGMSPMEAADFIISKTNSNAKLKK